MERFFKDSRTIKKFRTGPLDLNIQQLADELFHHGYTRHSIRVRIQTLGHFGRWLKKCRIPLQNVTSALIESYVYRHGSVRNGDGKVLRMLLDLLSRNGLVPQAVQAPADDNGAASMVTNFSDYLRQQRGLASGTINNHRNYVTMFLGDRFPNGAIDLSKIEAKDFVTFVQREAARRTPMSAKNVSTVLRSFATYLFSTNVIDRDLSGSIPTVRSWSLTGIPKAMTRKQVTRVLASCNRKTTIGRRDYAILLLLVRLGLRAGR